MLVFDVAVPLNTCVTEDVAPIDSFNMTPSVVLSD